MALEIPDDCIRVDNLRNLLGELRMMARQVLQSESHPHSFTPTALALTALRRAKLCDQDWMNVRWENRAHFFTALSTAMRHALIDYARRRKAKGRNKVIYFPPDESFFSNLPTEADERPERLIIVEEAVAMLSTADERLGEVIQQFYYLGHSIADIAAQTGVSEKTVDRDLKRARTLLRKIIAEMPSVA